MQRENRVGSFSMINGAIPRHQGKLEKTLQPHPLVAVPIWDYDAGMHVVSRALLVAFYSQSKYADSQAAIEAWFDIATKAQWRSPADVKAAFEGKPGYGQF